MPTNDVIFTGEAMALLEAIKFIACHKYNKSVIFTDSLSCLNAIDSNPLSKGSCFPLILQIREQLHHCHINNLQVYLAWIPSHTGIRNNEIVDSFAKDAIVMGSQDFSKVFSRDLLILANKDLRKDWSIRWEKSKETKGKYYAAIQPDIPNRPWFSRYRVEDKHTTSVICRLRLGHSCTPLHLHKIKIRTSPVCDCGTEEGTVDHIFFNCPLQPVSLYDILPSKIPKPTNMKSLLLITNLAFLKLLSKYVSVYKIKV
jgi:hypothetical protein